MTPVILETPRLHMRQLKEEDWQLFLRLHRDENVIAYVSDPQPLPAIRDRFDSRLLPWQKESQQWLCLAIIDKQTGDKLGITGFLPEWAPFQQAEVGFMLLPEFYGNGYGLESLRAVVHFAFAQCQFNKLKATVTEGNEASCAVLKKAGFSQEGILRENYQLNGQWCSDVLFGLLASEYNEAAKGLS